jgi:hypothetical protein
MVIDSIQLAAVVPSSVPESTGASAIPGFAEAIHRALSLEDDTAALKNIVPKLKHEDHCNPKLSSPDGEDEGADELVVPFIPITLILQPAAMKDTEIVPGVSTPDSVKEIAPPASLNVPRSEPFSSTQLTLGTTTSNEPAPTNLPASTVEPFPGSEPTPVLVPKTENNVDSEPTSTSDAKQEPNLVIPPILAASANPISATRMPLPSLESRQSAATTGIPHTIPQTPIPVVPTMPKPSDTSVDPTSDPGPVHQSLQPDVGDPIPFLNISSSAPPLRQTEPVAELKLAQKQIDSISQRELRAADESPVPKTTATGETSSAKPAIKDAQTSATEGVSTRAPQAEPTITRHEPTPAALTLTLAETTSARASTHSPVESGREAPADRAAQIETPLVEAPTPGSVHLLSRVERQEMRFQWNTPEFGHVEVRTTVDHERVGAVVAVPDQNFRDSLQSDLGTLSRALADHSLELTDFQTSNSGSNPQSRQQSETYTTSTGKNWLSAVPNTTVPTGGHTVSHVGLLDLRA